MQGRALPNNGNQAGCYKALLNRSTEYRSKPLISRLRILQLLTIGPFKTVLIRVKDQSRKKFNPILKIYF